jgi:hypothetical protein
MFKEEAREKVIERRIVKRLKKADRKEVMVINRTANHSGFIANPAHQIPFKLQKSFTGPQIKYFDTVEANTISTTGFGLLNMTQMPQGVAQGDRVSDRVFLIGMSYKLAVNSGLTLTSNYVRFGFFRWKEDNSGGNTPTGAILFTQFGPITTGGAQGVLANFDHENYGMRFTILEDMVFAVSGITTAPTAKTNVWYQGNVNLKHNAPCQFNPGLLTGINQIYFYNYSDAGATQPTYSLVTRVYYHE